MTRRLGVYGLEYELAELFRGRVDLATTRWLTAWVLRETRVVYEAVQATCGILPEAVDLEKE